jgi:predicted transcriptional regulator
MSVSVNIPDELYRRASEIAAAEKISVDDVFASAFEERLLELERLKEKASHGSYEKFLRVMSKIPAVEPPESDRL